VTSERYIKSFDPADLAAMKGWKRLLDVVSKCSPTSLLSGRRLIQGFRSISNSIAADCSPFVAECV